MFISCFVPSVLFLCLSSKALIRVMNLASEEGMTTEEYVYFTYTTVASHALFEPWGHIEHLDEVIADRIITPFQRLKMVFILILLCKFLIYVIGTVIEKIIVHKTQATGHGL